MNEEIIKLYIDGNSIYSIVKILNRPDEYYPQKIRRILIKSGVRLRDKSEAQTVAIENGRSIHPTKGKKLSEEVKAIISEKMYASWKNLDENEKKRRVETARLNWDKKSEGEKEEMRRLAGEAVRIAAKKGSKLENFLLKTLRDNGEDVIFHKKGLIENVDLEVDIFLPKRNLVIEIDGPTHFLPIWGEEKLAKQIKADVEKAGLLLASGIKILRVKNLSKNLSDKLKRSILSQILDILNRLDDLNNFIELEIV